MDAEPGPARLQIAAGDDAAAVVPLVKRRRSARVELVAVADEDERPVRMDAMGEGDDTHAAHIGAARALAKCVTDRFMLYYMNKSPHCRGKQRMIAFHNISEGGDEHDRSCQTAVAHVGGGERVAALESLRSEGRRVGQEGGST